MAGDPALRPAGAHVIPMSDNSQSAAPNTENTSRIGSPWAGNRRYCGAWQRTFDAFWLQPAGLRRRTLQRNQGGRPNRHGRPPA
jgi:hypothetical protein